MRISDIHEGRASPSDKVVAALKNFGIEKPFGSEFTISLTATPDLLPALKRLVRHYGWQIHSTSKVRKGIVYIDITPIKNKLYDGSADKLYHITDRSNLTSIQSQGLNLRSETPGMTFPKRLYLYPTVGMAVSRYKMAKALERFANKTMNDPILLVIDNRHKKYNVFIDPEFFMGMGEDEDDLINVPVYTTKTVAPRDISVAEIGTGR